MPKQPANMWRLSSLKQLVILAFVAVVAPFGILIYYATDQLVDQSSQGRVLAQQALEVTRRGQQLQQQAEAITRAAKQFEILQREDIRQRLLQLINEFEQQFTLHQALYSNPEQNTLIQHVLDHYRQNTSNPPAELQQLTQTMNQSVDQYLDTSLQRLNQVAQDTQVRLEIVTLLLLAISLLLMIIFSRSIIQPVKRIARRIRAMGTGESYENLGVGGPQELVSLEQQLNWLSEQLSAAEEEKHRFLRHMSHELKTPLTTLREGSDLLAEQVTGALNESQQEIASLLQSNARQLQQLIEQLLDYNRLAQLQPTKGRPVALLPLLQQACEPHQLLLEQKQITLHLPQHDLTWHTDADMLLRILTNLISNAAQYGAKQGEIRLKMFIEDKQLFIDVQNKGPTIPSSDVPHLFEPFYQGQNRRAGPVRGSGIGLSIVKDAASALGGYVTLQHNKDHTVCFRVNLTQMDAA
ncbi:HAMP domain-containing sensor histidine kinase [Pontibacter sp. JAM-7]|uniref:HAMP domain-containing sensor histidine kinase n=1 Tax=Pontibacter sp. JAM-7 TaxID=3366581 RepID=UPI003AF83B7B